MILHIAHVMIYDAVIIIVEEDLQLIVHFNVKIILTWWKSWCLNQNIVLEKAMETYESVRKVLSGPS